MRLLAVLLLAVSVGCVYSPAGPGLLYMDVKGPMGPADGTNTDKVGRACANNILSLVTFGDASIESAKRDGGITKVTTIDSLASDHLPVVATISNAPDRE